MAVLGPITEPILGTQRLSLRSDAASLLALAADHGFAWVDVADVYGHATGDAERLVAGIAHRVRIITKGGLVRDGKRWLPDGRAGHLEHAAERSLERLGRIDLYLLHAPDPRVDLRTTARALRRLLERGVVGAVGACNLGVDELRQMLEIVPISAVQVELSPFNDHAVRSGIVEACRARGIPVLAHRPLGGEAVGKVRRNPLLRDVGLRCGGTPEEVALAWLTRLGVTPVPGPTRPETLLSCRRTLVLGEDETVLLDREFAAGRLRRTRADRAPRDPDGDVVLIVGSPGSGKTSRVAAYLERGYARLNRDERGGRLDDLLPELDRLLAAGQRRVVLDNTYATRASRNGVVEVAWARGAPVRAEWVDTSAEDCEVNLVHRILDLLGRLPNPDEFERLNTAVPGVVPPRAISRYREEYEATEAEEGLTRVDRIPFVRRGGGENALMILDPRHLVAANAQALRAAQARGYRLVVAGWQPVPYLAARDEIIDDLTERATALGVSADVVICPHPAGPQLCWCRKPFVGLVVERPPPRRSVPQRRRRSRGGRADDGAKAGDAGHRVPSGPALTPEGAVPATFREAGALEALRDASGPERNMARRPAGPSATFTAGPEHGHPCGTDEPDLSGSERTPLRAAWRAMWRSGGLDSAVALRRCPAPRHPRPGDAVIEEW